MSQEFPTPKPRAGPSSRVPPVHGQRSSVDGTSPPLTPPLSPTLRTQSPPLSPGSPVSPSRHPLSGTAPNFTFKEAVVSASSAGPRNQISPRGPLRVVDAHPAETIEKIQEMEQKAGYGSASPSSSLLGICFELTRFGLPKV
jgi:hypothetical protein